MITFERALEIATHYYQSNPNRVLTKVYESENAWIVFSAVENLPQYSSSGISIDKNSGEIKRFILPSRENFKILHDSRLVELR